MLPTKKSTKKLTQARSPGPSDLSVLGYSCSLFNDHLYLFGGFSQQSGMTLNELRIYSIIDNAWVQPTIRVADKFPTGRLDHSACVYKDMIFLVGGRYHPDNEETIRTTDVLLLDTENPEIVTWTSYGQVNNIGPQDCIGDLSHIHDDKMFLYDSQNYTLSYYDFRSDRWHLNRVQGKSNYFENRVVIFCENKVFAFLSDPECKDSRYRHLLMLDLDSINSLGNWELIAMLENHYPSIIPSQIHCSMNGLIYIFATESRTQNNELWSYNPNGNAWEKIEDSGSLALTIGERHTMPYKNQILSVLADVQTPSIEIQSVTLSGESAEKSGILTRKETCKDNDEQFINDYKILYERMLFTDVVFEVEGQEIPAHKSILAYRSPYFMSLFNSLGQEPKVQIPDIKAELFRGILQYLYCNEIELNEDLALQLLPVLDNFLLENLKGICERYLTRQIRKENVISMLLTADKHKIQKLKEACFRFIVKNLEKVAEGEEVMELSKPLFLELLKFQVEEKRPQKEVSEEKEMSKKKRGRPPKYHLTKEEFEAEEAPKRGRGRPKKAF